jgi:hypothetical protein
MLLSFCLLPYLISSVYSIITALLQVEAAPAWLWGDWINTLVGESDALYMLLAEGPICCVGSISLLVLILGLVLGISSMGGASTSQPTQQYYYPALDDTEIDIDTDADTY